MKAKIFFRNLGHAIAFPFVAVSLLIGLSKSKGLYKKYYSDNELLTEEERYTYVYKQVSKATFIANCKINYEGLDKVPQVPVMYVCNHKAGFDPLLLLKIFSKEEKTIRPVFVSKIELLQSKNVGNAAKLIDTIFLDRKNIRSAYKCIEEEKKILSKRSVVVFIEGTRVHTHEFGEFKSAALEPAFATMRPIIPVVIQGSIGVEQEDKKSFFKYKEINVRFLPQIKPIEFVHTNREGISQKLKKIMQEKYNELEQNNKSRLYDPNKIQKDNFDNTNSDVVEETQTLVESIEYTQEIKKTESENSKPIKSKTSKKTSNNKNKKSTSTSSKKSNKTKQQKSSSKNKVKSKSSKKTI